MVLAKVPLERAGLGSGVLATAQQSSLALGVATLGTLYLALVPSWGAGHALTLILAIQLAGAAVILRLAAGLPRTMG